MKCLTNCLSQYYSDFFRLTSRMEEKYRSRFRNLVGFFFVSPPAGKGIDALHASLVDVVSKQVGYTEFHVNIVKLTRI